MKRLNLLYLAGVLVIAIGFFASPAPGWAAYGDHLSDITTGGLNQPAKMAVDPANGDVYVTDAGNKVVKKYDKNGNYDATFNLSVSGTPVGIAVNATNIFVGDSVNKCVWIYNKSGALTDLSSTGTTHKLGGTSPANCQKNMPNAISIAPSGQIFMLDGDNDKGSIFSSAGLYLGSFGASGTATTGSIQTYYPTGITFGSNLVSGRNITQYFYIGDQGNFRVLKLHYIYDAYTNNIVTYPQLDQVIGSKGDSLGHFLRLSSISWDSVYQRLIAVDSLQMVGQLFNSSGTSMSPTLNYNSTTGVLGYLNVPTDVVADNSNRKVYIASNQSNSISVFTIAQGAPPVITSVTPTADVTPVTAPYSVTVSGTDSDSASVTERFYYFDVTAPAQKNLFASQTVNVTGGSYSGTYGFDFTSLPVGSYKIYAEVADDTGNTVNASSVGNIIVAGNYDGCAGYTSAMYAKWGPSAADFDGDGLSNCEEITGVHPDQNNHYTSDPGLADTDGDGLNDKEERDAATLWPSICTCFLNPRDPDTDHGGVSDYNEIQRGTNPCSSTDDYNSPPQVIGLPINVGDPTFVWDSYIDLRNTSTGPSSVTGSDGNKYRCIKNHLSDSTTQPITGANWSKYWVLDNTTAGGTWGASQNYVTGTVVGDIRFVRGSDGATIATIPGISLPPNGSTRLKVNDYLAYPANNNVSVDFVAAGAKKVIVVADCHKVNYQDPALYDEDYAAALDAAGAPVIYSGAYNDETAAYRTWMALKNPNSTTPIDVKIEFYAVGGGAPVYTKYVYNIPPYGSSIYKPSDNGIVGGSYHSIIYGYAAGTQNPANVTGYYVQFHQSINDTSGNVYDNLYACVYETQTASTFYIDGSNDAYAGYIAWYGVSNPSSTATITMQATYYSSSGTLLGTGQPHTIGPNAVYAFRPKNDLGVASFSTGQSAVITVTGGPATAMGFQFHLLSGTSINDHCAGMALSRNPGTSFEAPVWTDSGNVSGGTVTWLAARNDTAGTITVTCAYYNPDGSVSLDTNNQPAIISQTVPANGVALFRPSSYPAGHSIVGSQGSAKITATGNVTGYILRFMLNPYTYSTNGANMGGMDIPLVPSQ